MKWTLIDQAGTNDPDTGDIYSGLDRFGRVKDNRWIDGAGADLDRIQYGYDRAGNRIWRKNVVAAALGKQFDELYTYDGVHRLQDMARGTLNGSHTALTSEIFAESWTLDSTGNWRGFKQDDNGDGTWNLIQSRTANPVNEITDIAESTGPSWTQPAYNRAGNMTTMPQPADPTASYTATYDAWNRLVKIADGADTVSEYAYDGAERRIVQKSYTGGTLDETRHLYYTEPSMWQVLEERVGTSPDSADAERQFVWGKRYIDDLILRDRDTDDNYSLDERFYACQDANWNLAAIVDTAEEVRERYAYSAYGNVRFLADSFNGKPSTNVGWHLLYCGCLLDIRNGLFLIRHRVYHPASGVWTQRDPLKYRDGTALYAAYFGLNGMDPFGTAMIRCTCDIDGINDIGGTVLAGTYTVDTFCAGLGDTCCSNACSPNSFRPGMWSLIPNTKPLVYFPFGCGSGSASIKVTAFGPVTPSTFVADNLVLQAAQLVINAKTPEIKPISVGCGHFQKCCPLASINSNISVRFPFTGTFPIPNPFRSVSVTATVNVQVDVSISGTIGVCVPDRCPCPPQLPTVNIDQSIDIISLIGGIF